MRFDRDLPRWLVGAVLVGFALSQVAAGRYGTALVLAALAALSLVAAWTSTGRRDLVDALALVAAAVTAGAAGVWWQVGADAVLLAAVLVAGHRHTLYEVVDRS